MTPLDLMAWVFAWVLVLAAVILTVFAIRVIYAMTKARKPKRDQSVFKSGNDS